MFFFSSAGTNWNSRALSGEATVMCSCLWSLSLQCVVTCFCRWSLCFGIHRCPGLLNSSNLWSSSVVGGMRAENGLVLMCDERWVDPSGLKKVFEHIWTEEKSWIQCGPIRRAVWEKD